MIFFVARFLAVTKPELIQLPVHPLSIKVVVAIIQCSKLCFEIELLSSSASDVLLRLFQFIKGKNNIPIGESIKLSNSFMKNLFQMFLMSPDR